LASDATSATDTDQLVENQYKGREHLKPYYDKINLAAITEIDKEVIDWIRMAFSKAA
jgi:hypothetical protein